MQAPAGTCPIVTNSCTSMGETPGAPRALIKAYKLGSKRYSYNEIELTVAADNNCHTRCGIDHVRNVSEIENGCEFFVKLGLLSKSEVKLRAYLCKGEAVEHDIIANGSSTLQQKYRWSLVQRQQCHKDCSGPVLRPIKRHGILGKRQLDQASDPANAPRLKDTRFLYLSFDEACSHVDTYSFRLVIGMYDIATDALIGSAVSPAVRVVANNVVQDGAPRIKMTIRAPSTWSGWENSIPWEGLPHQMEHQEPSEGPQQATAAPETPRVGSGRSCPAPTIAPWTTLPENHQQQQQQQQHETSPLLQHSAAVRPLPTRVRVAVTKKSPSPQASPASNALSKTGYKYVYCSSAVGNGPSKWHTNVRWRQGGNELKVAVWSCTSLRQALLVHDAIAVYRHIQGMDVGAPQAQYLPDVDLYKDADLVKLLKKHVLGAKLNEFLKSWSGAKVGGCADNPAGVPLSPAAESLQRPSQGMMSINAPLSSSPLSATSNRHYQHTQRYNQVIDTYAVSQYIAGSHSNAVSTCYPLQSGLPPPGGNGWHRPPQSNSSLQTGTNTVFFNESVITLAFNKELGNLRQLAARLSQMQNKEPVRKAEPALTAVHIGAGFRPYTRQPYNSIVVPKSFPNATLQHFPLQGAE